MLSSDTPVIIQSSRSQRLTLIAILAAFALFLSTVEYMIPKPVPFLRVGLANLPVLIALSLLSIPELFVLVSLKIVGQGLVNGTLFSYIFLFSAGGSLVSTVAMLLFHRMFRKWISYVGISIAGALASNTVQLLLAQLILFGSGIWLVAPPFLLMGLVTSVALGLFVNHFSMSSTWFREKEQLNGGGQHAQ